MTSINNGNHALVTKTCLSKAYANYCAKYHRQ